jgi:signal transduction histidine kinase
VRLGELVDGCIGRRTQEERERIETAEAVETEVLADRAQLARALHNLLDNALVHGGGTVRVAVVDGADGVEVHVLDEGPGVDPEVRPHAFDRFAHRSGSPGAGLGLPVVAEIARAHGGGCGLADRDGGGTDAWLMLPRRPGAAAPTAPAVGAVASRRTAQVQARRAQ